MGKRHRNADGTRRADEPKPERSGAFQDYEARRQQIARLGQAGRTDEALRLLSADPGVPFGTTGWWKSLAEPLSQKRDLNGEIELLQRVRKAGVADPPLHARLAWLLLRADRLREAEIQMAALRPYGGRKLWMQLLRQPGTSDEDGSAADAPSGPTGGVLTDRSMVFLHIEKAGGTTVERGLKTLFGREPVRRISPRHVKAGPVEKLAENWGEVDVITSPFAAPTARVRAIPPGAKPPAFLSVVRDPVERLRSVYSYARLRRGSDEDRSERLGVPYDPDINVVVRRWLEDEAWITGQMTYQCRIISGKTSAEAAIKSIERYFLGVVTTSRISDLLAAMSLSVRGRLFGGRRARSSHSERFDIDPDLAARMRAGREDQALFEWVSANEDRLLERARSVLAAWAQPTAEGMRGKRRPREAASG